MSKVVHVWQQAYYQEQENYTAEFEQSCEWSGYDLPTLKQLNKQAGDYTKHGPWRTNLTSRNPKLNVINKQEKRKAIATRKSHWGGKWRNKQTKTLEQKPDWKFEFWKKRKIRFKITQPPTSPPPLPCE